MRYPQVAAFLGLTAQVPLQNPIETTVRSMVDETPNFAFKEAPDIFSPKDLVYSLSSHQIQSLSDFEYLDPTWTPRESCCELNWRSRISSI